MATFKVRRKDRFRSRCGIPFPPMRFPYDGSSLASVARTSTRVRKYVMKFPAGSVQALSSAASTVFSIGIVFLGYWGSTRARIGAPATSPSPCWHSPVLNASVRCPGSPRLQQKAPTMNPACSRTSRVSGWRRGAVAGDRRVRVHATMRIARSVVRSLCRRYAHRVFLFLGTISS